MHAESYHRCINYKRERTKQEPAGLLSQMTTTSQQALVPEQEALVQNCLKGYFQGRPSKGLECSRKLEVGTEDSLKLDLSWLSFFFCLKPRSPLKKRMENDYLELTEIKLQPSTTLSHRLTLKIDTTKSVVYVKLCHFQLLK